MPEPVTSVPAQHRIVVVMDGVDTWPYLSEIECDWGTDPLRPCRMIHCDICAEDASDECLDGEEPHDGAHVIEGCGVALWLKDCGPEGIRVEGLSVKVPADLSWNGDGWTLSCREENNGS